MAADGLTAKGLIAEDPSAELPDAINLKEIIVLVLHPLINFMYHDS